MRDVRYGEGSGTLRAGAWFSALSGVWQATPVWKAIARALDLKTAAGAELLRALEAILRPR